MKNYKLIYIIFFLVFYSCSKEDEINKLNDTIINLQNQISNLNNQIDDFSNQISQLAREKNELINDNAEYLNQISQLNNQLNTFEDLIQDYIDEIQVLTENNEILQTDNDYLESQIQVLQEKINLIESGSAEEGIYLFTKLNLIEPPFNGTLWDLPDLISSSDYTIYSNSVYEGIETRLFYDTSMSDFIDYPAHIYNVSFGDGLNLDLEIITEFSEQDASEIHQEYAPLIGQLGRDLRKNIKSFEFLKGEYRASAQRTSDLSYANITLHTDWLKNIVEVQPDGDRTEELLIHEASHLSIDPYVYGKKEWNDAVSLDGNYLSKYAKDNPNSEDAAETFQAYIAVKYFPERISNTLKDTILSVCLNRFKFFDSLNLDLSIYK